MKIMELRLSCTLTMSGGARSRLVAIALGAVGDAGGIDTMLVCALSLSLSLSLAGAHSQTRSPAHGMAGFVRREITFYAHINHRRERERERERAGIISPLRKNYIRKGKGARSPRRKSARSSLPPIPIRVIIMRMCPPRRCWVRVRRAVRHRPSGGTEALFRCTRKNYWHAVGCGAAQDFKSQQRRDNI